MPGFVIVDVVELNEREAAGTLGGVQGVGVRRSHERLLYVLVTLPLPGHATITLELVLEDEETNKVGMTIRSKPMIPLHDVARLLELAAEEIRAGRLGSVRLG